MNISLADPDNKSGAPPRWDGKERNLQQKMQGSIKIPHQSGSQHDRNKQITNVNLLQLQWLLLTVPN